MCVLGIEDFRIPDGFEERLAPLETYEHEGDPCFYGARGTVEGIIIRKLSVHLNLDIGGEREREVNTRTITSRL